MSTKKRKQQPKLNKETIETNIFNKINLNIKKFDLTEKQKSLIELAFQRDTKIIFISGVAGSAKTFISVYAALHLLNADPRYQIKYIRTIAESGEKNLGSLPGDVDEKFNPFMMPLLDKLDELIPIDQSNFLEREGHIEAIPINLIRGADWHNKIIIADETQNYSIKELLTLLTRIGENTKMFICGDAMQSDINGKTGFSPMFDLFNTKESEEQGIYCFEFDELDIVRSEILKYIVKICKKL